MYTISGSEAQSLESARGHSPEELRARLRECMRDEPAEPLRRVPGRETFAVDGLGGATWVIKRFTGRWVGESPAEREHGVLEALRAEGLRVPAAVGYLDESDRCLVAMERVEARGDLRAALSEVERSALEPLLTQLLELVLSLHTRGWHHRDLYLHHILVAGDGELTLIDLGRARRPRWVRRRWFAKDLAALLLWTPQRVGALQRLRFLSKYMDRMEITGRRTRRAFARDVSRRRERMAQHVPRYGEEGAWEVPS